MSIGDENPWATFGSDSENDPYRQSFEDDRRYDDEGDDEHEEYEDEDIFPPQRMQKLSNGGSGCKKGCLIVLSIFGVLCLTCCCGFGVLVYYFMPTQVNGQNAINELRKELVEIEMPRELVPRAGITMGVSFLYIAKFVGYSTEDGKIRFQLIRVDANFADATEIHTNFEENIHSLAHTLESKTEKKKTITVQGKQYEFTITKGKEVETGKDAVIVSGEILLYEKETSGVSITIMLSSTDPKFGEKEAIKMIESITIPE